MGRARQRRGIRRRPPTDPLTTRLGEARCLPVAEAQKNHDELFPGHVSTLAVTDPELIEYFDNFAFDEMLRDSSLDTRTRLMVQLASLIACQAPWRVRVMLGAALTVGVTPVEVKEIVYQAVPYVGMGKVFDFIHTTNEVLIERGIELPLEGQSTTTPDTRAEQGAGGPEGDRRRRARRSDVRLRARGRDAHPAAAVGELLRGSLHPHRPRHQDARAVDLRDAGVAGRLRPQAKGHVAAQPHVGNDRESTDRSHHALLPFIGYPRTLNALARSTRSRRHERRRERSEMSQRTSLIIGVSRTSIWAMRICPQPARGS